MNLDDARMPYSRHRVFNLTRPAKSLILLAPLARTGGGFGICGSGKDKKPVFASTEDPDYAKRLALCEKGRQQLEEVKRFDMPGFRPRSAYIREMKRYGILPPSQESKQDPVDPYVTDGRYWESMWHRVDAKR